MSKRTPVTTIKVHPLFQKKLKIRAAEEGTTIVDLTKRLADNQVEEISKTKKKNGEWRFGF